MASVLYGWGEWGRAEDVFDNSKINKEAEETLLSRQHTETVLTVFMHIQAV